MIRHALSKCRPHVTMLGHGFHKIPKYSGHSKHVLRPFSVLSPQGDPSSQNNQKEDNIAGKPQAKASPLNAIVSTVKGALVAGIDMVKNPAATWAMIKEVAHHYWLGSKLLVAEINSAWSILGRIKSGHEMTRRERLHLIRTAGDIFRLVPFSIFVIVPFMEFLLPFALKLFPNMLPSTFQDALKKEEDMKKELQMRLALADFLHETLQTMATKRASTTANNTKDPNETGATKVIGFLHKLKMGESLQNEKVLEIARLFKDELTLPNMGRPQLISLCQYMRIPTFGSDSILRFQLRNKMKAIKEDDRRILWEGIESLTALELSEACRDRGMRAHGMNTVRYQKQLKDWLDLSIQKNVPIALLIMSRAFSLSNSSSLSEDVLKSSISALDKETINEVVLSVASPNEENTSDMQMRKLESIHYQQELIEDEREESEEAKRLKEMVVTQTEPHLAATVVDTAGRDTVVEVSGVPVEAAVEIAAPPPIEEEKVVNRTAAPGHRGLGEDEEAVLLKPTADNDAILAAATLDAQAVAAKIHALPSAAAVLAAAAATVGEPKDDMKIPVTADTAVSAAITTATSTTTIPPTSAHPPVSKTAPFDEEEDGETDLTVYDLEAIGDMARTNSVQREKAALTLLQTQLEAVAAELVKPAASTTVDAAAVKDATEAPTTAVKKKAANVKSQDKSIANMHSMLSKMVKRLENQIDTTEKAVGSKLHVLDLDEDGQLSADELRAGITNTLKADISDEDIQELINILDQDKDGKVSVAELLKYVEAMKEKKEIEFQTPNAPPLP